MDNKVNRNSIYFPSIPFIGSGFFLQLYWFVHTMPKIHEGFQVHNLELVVKSLQLSTSVYLQQSQYFGGGCTYLITVIVISSKQYFL